MTTTEKTCAVCGETLESHTEAWCMNCGRAYHLNSRTDLAGRDCGQVWINEEHLSLEFACNECLNPQPHVDLEDVLDIAEAAMLAGVAEAELAEVAAAGAIRHRQTSGGIYLFVRRDVVAYLEGRQ